MISPDAESALHDAYDSLTAEVEKKGFDSIWGYILNVKNNTRYTMFYSAAVRIAGHVAEELVSEGLMRPSIDDGQYVLTASGIRHVEASDGVDTLEVLIGEIDSRFFEVDVKKLSSREKIVLFSMVMVRCFSEDCCIDAKKDEAVKRQWMDIFLRAEGELKRLGVIKGKTSIQNLGKKSDIEKPMSNIIRHTDAIDSKTKMMYKKTGRNQYYLDMLDDAGSIDVEKLSFIIGLIFEDKLTYDNISELVDFCNESSRMDSILVFDQEKQIFYGSDNDDLVEEAFRAAYRSDIFSRS